MLGRAALITCTSAAGIALLLSLKPHHSPVAAPPPAPPPAPPTPGGGAAQGKPAHGVFRGQSIETEYGPVQVEITVSQGHLTAVRTLRLPSENSKDRKLAANAVPKLTREALATGNARIHTVSGATYTSEGYTASLQSALDKAHV
ncbi:MULTISPECIES: FMN-binding protein [Thermomonosporaceae]|uniref:FMN-binding protein n=1 Tax=Thermomonosporaceae TaxID=2012 RepID=UPI00255AEEB5|nr:MULTISPECIES: FMN-binding protein [Thermomonosporaceae]MDL4773526.1 FMN-binding protein [Actinomadura xylanilytica]